MSSCDEFTQNAWRKELCRNCLRPKWEHNAVENGKKKPNKTVAQSRSNEKENLKNSAISDKSAGKNQNGVICDTEKLKQGSVQKHTVKGNGLGVKTTDKKSLKSSHKLDSGVNTSTKDDTTVKSSPKLSKPISEKCEPVLKSTLRKTNYQKRLTSGVTFYVGIDYVIGEDGGLNGSDSEFELATAGDDDVKHLPQSQEEKRLAKLTFDNTNFNSEPQNLKETVPPSDPDKSLTRSKSIGSQEFLEIENALLWHPSSFSSYVNSSGNIKDVGLVSRKSPPPSCSDTRVVVPTIDIGEKETVPDSAHVPSRNESVFKLSGVQPCMNLSGPYNANSISPGNIVLPYPADSETSAYKSLTNNQDNVSVATDSKFTAKTSGALRSESLRTDSSDLNNRADKSSHHTCSTSSSQLTTTAKQSAPHTYTANRNTKETQPEKVRPSPSNSKSSLSAKPKVVTTPITQKSKPFEPVNKTTTKETRDKGSINLKDTKQTVGLAKTSSSLGSSGKFSSGSPVISQPSARKSSLGTSGNLSSGSPPISQASASRTIIKGAKTAQSVGAHSAVEGSVGREQSQTSAGNFVDEKKNLSGSSLPAVAKDTLENLVSEKSEKPCLTDIEQTSDSAITDVRQETDVTGAVKRRSIKRPAPAPPPPPPSGSSDTSIPPDGSCSPLFESSTVSISALPDSKGLSDNTHHSLVRLASAPTPLFDQNTTRKLTMATRSISVDAGDVTPRSQKSSSSETNSQKSNQDSTTPKKNKLSSGSFLKKILRKKDKQKDVSVIPDDRSFSPTWVDPQEIEFMDDSFSDGSFDDDLVDSVEMISVNSSNTESSADWNNIFKNFGKSDLEIAEDGTTESPTVGFNESASPEKKQLKSNRLSDGSMDQSPDLNKKSDTMRKSSFEAAKLNESPQRKWDQDKIDTLRKSRDISGPLGLDGRPKTLPQRPVSVAVKSAGETLNNAEMKRSPRPRSLEKSPMHESRRSTIQKPIKKPPAPPPPVPAVTKYGQEEGPANTSNQVFSERRLPLETMTLDRKSRGSPRPTSGGDQITRPKPPPPPPPSTLPRSRSSPDKNPLPKRPPPPKFKPQMSGPSHVYEEYGTRHVRGSKAQPPTARHQYEYIFDKPGKGRSRDNSPATQVVKPHEYGVAYEPIAVSPEHPGAKPLTEKPMRMTKSSPKPSVEPKPKRSHLYEIIHPEDRDTDLGRAQQVSPPYNGRYESVDESPRHARRRNDHGKGEENIYDVVEVPPIPVNMPDSPTSLSRYSRSFEDYLVPIRRGSVDAAEGSGTDDEILEEDALGSLPDLTSGTSSNFDEKKEDGHTPGLLESVLQKLKEPKKIGRKSSMPETSKSKKFFSTRSLTRRPRSSRHNSLPAGVDIVMIKSQESESLKSRSGSLATDGTRSNKSRSTGTGSVRSFGSMEEYVDMSGASGKEDDPSPSSTGSIGESNSPVLPRSKPQTPSVRGRTCLPAPPTLTRGQIDIGEANIHEMFSNIANMNLQTLNQVLRDMEVPKRATNTSTVLRWESFHLESETPLMRSAALAFYKATLSATRESLVLMISFDKVPDELSSKFHCNGLKQRCNFEDDIPCQFHPDSILQQIVGANMSTALTSHCRVTVLEYTNISALNKYLDTFADDTDEYFHEVCFILVQLLQYTIYLLDRGYEFSDLTGESLLITQSGQSKNHVLLNPGQVHQGNGDKLKLMCQEVVTLIFKLHEIDSFEIYDKMSHLPYKKTVLKITQLLSAGQFSNMVQGLDMLGFVLWGPTKELRQLQRSNNIALECQCWLDVECAKKVNSLARGEDRDSIWTYYQVKYLCETDGRKLATICDTYNLGTG